MRVDWCVSSWLRYQEYSLTFSPCSPPAPHSPLALEHLATETQPSKGGGQFFTFTCVSFQPGVDGHIGAACSGRSRQWRWRQQAMTKAEATVGWISSTSSPARCSCLRGSCSLCSSNLVKDWLEPEAEGHLKARDFKHSRHVTRIPGRAGR